MAEPTYKLAVSEFMGLACNVATIVLMALGVWKILSLIGVL